MLASRKVLATRRVFRAYEKPFEGFAGSKVHKSS